MKVTLVVKKTRYETADAAARRLLDEDDPSVRGWLPAHKRHHFSLEEIAAVLARTGVSLTTVGNPYESFDTSGSDLVVVVGGDGTFLAASHSVGDVPMLGVNSDTESSRGFFCGADRQTFGRKMGEFASGTAMRARIQRMEVSVDGSVKSRRVLNEALVCHPHPAATSRFSVSFGTEETSSGWEANMSSGAWIGPPAGTTGAIRSAGGDVLPLEAELLEFVSRETIIGESRKKVTADAIRARVRTDRAAVYMDGPFRQAELRLGQVAEFRLSGEPLSVVGLDGRR
jgi:NAD+ kinase